MPLIPSREQIYKALHERNAVQRFLSRKLFGLGQALGFHVVGDHFYEPIPNTALIERTYSDNARPCRGIDFGFAAAERLALSMVEPVAGSYAADVARFGFQEANHYYRGLDALHLYGFQRQFRPATTFEIGQGFSTRVHAAAMAANRAAGGPAQRLVSIDPYSRVSEEPVFAEVELRLERAFLEKSLDLILGQLVAGDLLFIDSSHVFKFGSDVELIFDELLPQVPAGVYIHFHDVFSPYNYPKQWLTRAKRFWNEQYVLENFLRFNDRFRVILPTCQLARQSDALRQLVDARIRPQVPNFEHAGSSFYLQRLS